MDGLILKIFTLGCLCTNSYVVYHRSTKKGFIVDLPSPSFPISRYIEENEIEISSVFLTHGHFDHIGGLDDCLYPFYIQEKDSGFLVDPDLNGSSLFGNPVIIKNKPLYYSGRRIEVFENMSIEIIPTPGHTPGSVSLKIDNLVFSGDALFAGSIGRTDLPLASHDVLVESIKRRILTLPEETEIYPGHGISTTVAEEIRANPFFKVSDSYT